MKGRIIVAKLEDNGPERVRSALARPVDRLQRKEEKAGQKDAARSTLKITAINPVRSAAHDDR